MENQWPLENDYIFQVYENKKARDIHYFVEIMAPNGSIQNYRNLTWKEVDDLYSMVKLFRRK